MVSRNQVARSLQPQERPNGRSSGELFFNAADVQLAAVDPQSTSVDLIAVRYHASSAFYQPGDLVAYSGSIWAAKQEMVGIGFDPSLWTNLIPDLAPYYLKTGGLISGPVAIAGAVDVTGTSVFRNAAQFDGVLNVAGDSNLNTVVSSNGNFISRAGAATGNTHYWLQDSAGTSLACVYAAQPDGTLNFGFGRMTKFAALRASDGALIVPAELYASNTYRVWHAGNFNPGAYLPLVGGTLTGSLGINPGSLQVSNGDIVHYHGIVYANLNGTGPAWGIQARGGAANGGVIGYNQTNSYYGILGYGEHTIYGNGYGYVSLNFGTGGSISVAGGLTAQGDIRAVGNVSAQQGYNVPTNLAPNVYISSTGRLVRATSSLAGKTNVEPLLPVYGDLVLSLKPIWFRSKLADDRKDWSHFGFGAEEVGAVDPRFALWDHRVLLDKDGRPQREVEEYEVPDIDKDSKPISIKKQRPGATKLGPIQPESVNLQAIVAALVELVQRQEARIKALEAGR